MKKKLLFINGHMNTGGVEKSLLDILTHLDYSRYEVDLLLLEELGDYANQIPQQVNVILHSLENTYGAFGKCILRCIRLRDWFSLKMRLILLSQRLWGVDKIAWAGKLLTAGNVYDSVIGFRSGICMEVAAFAVNACQRITWWHHGEINVDTRRYKESIARCDYLAVVSDSCRRMLEDEFPDMAQKLITINNLIDVERIQQKANAFNPQFEDNVIHIVSVGRLAAEKHFDNAVYTARMLKDSGVSFRWHLLGEGPQREALLEKVREQDVADCFMLEGNQVNPYPYLKHADLFVHPSYVESFGIVVAEALCLGIPCVVTKSVGVMDFLRDGENAILTEQSPESLTEAVIRVLENEELRCRLQKAAQCPESFLPDAVMKKMGVLLEESK